MAAMAKVAKSSEPARWAEALLAHAPGGRPEAAWVARRAARWLGFDEDAEEEARARAAQVKRAYLGVRARELRSRAPISPSLVGTTRAWVEEAVFLATKLAPHLPESDTRPLEPLQGMSRARWIVALVGPQASAWTLPEDAEDALADRLLALARALPASSWTLDDVRGGPRGTPRSPVWEPSAAAGNHAPGIESEERTARLARELARATPDARALAVAEDAVARGGAAPTLAIELASALLRAGESGRAWAALSGVLGDEASALRAEVARRRGDREQARVQAEQARASSVAAIAARGAATLARLAWDAGDLAAAEATLEGARGPFAAEVRALIAYRRDAHADGLRIVADALAETRDADLRARLEAVRGMLEHAKGDALASLGSFGRAVELATQSAAIVEEATYLTGEAAAATAAGDISRALGSATRAALLWERLGRPAEAARAWLSRAGALATIGQAHAADEAAEEARARAEESGDARAAAFADWAMVEVRPAGDPRARASALRADARLEGASEEDRARAAGRLLVWAGDAVGDARIDAIDAVAASLGGPARWEWWGARATAILAGRRSPGDANVLSALTALVDTSAPLSSRGPALEAAVRLARERGDAEAAQRFELARRAAARTLREGTPLPLRAALAEVAWARVPSPETADSHLRAGADRAAGVHRAHAGDPRPPTPSLRAGARHHGAVDRRRARASSVAGARGKARRAGGAEPGQEGPRR